MYQIWRWKNGKGETVGTVQLLCSPFRQIYLAQVISGNYLYCHLEKETRQRNESIILLSSPNFSRYEKIQSFEFWGLICMMYKRVFMWRQMPDVQIWKETCESNRHAYKYRHVLDYKHYTFFQTFFFLRVYMYLIRPGFRFVILTCKDFVVIDETNIFKNIWH
jgi:hypothetical protein